MFSKDSLINSNPSPHSPHRIIPPLISPGTTVLDVGCNTGMLGRSLHQSNILDGIDINSQALTKATAYYRHLYHIDLSSPGALSLKKKYDYIIFSDILEHLPRPDLTLKAAGKLLNKNAFVIASIPNIARLEIRLKLLFGQFSYTPSGILNRDHLRFFTRETGVELFRESGYKIVNIIPTGLGHQFNLFPRLTAFQFIYVAQISNEK